MVPPIVAMNATQCAAPCMNGGAGRSDDARRPLGVRDHLVERTPLAGRLVAAAHRRAEDVGLAPQHALGHAGGAAGVEDVEVVGETSPTPAASGDAAASVLVPLGPGEQLVAGLVGDLEQHGQLGRSGRTSPASARTRVVDDARGRPLSSSR